MRRGPGRRRTLGAAGPARDDGTVTAETAVVLPSVALVLLVAVGSIAAVTAQLRCADAAAVAARLAVRGESPAVVRAAALRVAPSGAAITLGHAAGAVVVTVSDPLRLPALGRLLPAPTVHAVFVAPSEPGTGSRP